MENKKMNKKAAFYSVVLLVITTIILVIVTGFVVLGDKAEIEQTLSVPNYNDDIKVQRLILDDYLEQIFEDSVKDFKPEQGKATFINNFKREMQVYKIGDKYVVKEFEEVEKQLVDENIELNNKSLTMILALNISRISKITDEDNIYAKYTYKKKFEKVFK